MPTSCRSMPRSKRRPRRIPARCCGPERGRCRWIPARVYHRFAESVDLVGHDGWRALVSIMPYFGLHYVGAYSVNPLGIRCDSEAPSRGRMDHRTTSRPGLLRAAVPDCSAKRLSHCGACHGDGTGRLGDRFRPCRLDQSRIGEVGALLRSTSALARARCAVRWSRTFPGVRPARSISTPSSGTSRPVGRTTA